MGRILAFAAAGFVVWPFVLHVWLTVLRVPQEWGYMAALVVSMPVGAVLGAVVSLVEAGRGVRRPTARRILAAIIYVGAAGLLAYATYGTS